VQISGTGSVVLSNFPSFFFALDLPCYDLPCFQWPQCNGRGRNAKAQCCHCGSRQRLPGWRLPLARGAAELKILSAGAVQPWAQCSGQDFFFDKTGDLAKIAYDPATVLGKAGPPEERSQTSIVSSPARHRGIDQNRKRCCLRAKSPLGKVGVGCRRPAKGAPAPDIAEHARASAGRKTLLDAEAVVYKHGIEAGPMSRIC